MSIKKTRKDLVNRVAKHYSLDIKAVEKLEKMHAEREIPRTRLLDKAIFLLDEIYDSGAQDYLKCLSHVHEKTGISKQDLVNFSMEQLLKHYIKDENNPE